MTGRFTMQIAVPGWNRLVSEALFLRKKTGKTV